MAISIGIDVGAVAVKLAALGAESDRALLDHACLAPSSFRAVAEGPFPLVVSTYLRAAGSPADTAAHLLRLFRSLVPGCDGASIGITGSGGAVVASRLGAQPVNGARAVARAVARINPGTRSVIEIGGETSTYLELGEDGLVTDYDHGGECAAGTGSFLDQQAARLGYSVEEMGDVVATASVAARIAGRCSVFAKSDMIHAQQKGSSPAEILRGLCIATARNYKSNVLKGRTAPTPAIFIGGVAANQGVVEALRQLLGFGDGRLAAPPFAAWYGAIGGALLAAESGVASASVRRGRPEPVASSSAPPEATRLTLEGVVLLRDRMTPAPPRGDGPVPAFLGIDVGSVSTNVVAADAAGQVLFDSYLRTAGRPVDAVQEGLRALHETWGSRLEILGVGTTGSGRELVAEFVGADVVHDEITAHKTGALHVSRLQGGPPVDTIFEIGGQDSKFIALEDGVVVDFTMNEACAAGTGSFLEEQAEKLGIDIKGEFARLALSAEAPARLGERCTVFMERDVTARLHGGESVPNLVAGLACSIVLNYLNRVVRGRRIGDVIYFQGGTAYNDAVAAAFAARLGKTITVPPYNGVIGAIGMALIASEWHGTRGRPTRFRGYDLSRVERRTRDFACRGCTNECAVREFTIEGEKSYWGDKCSDRYRKPARTSRQPVVEDLVACRERLVEQIAGEACEGVLPTNGNAVTVGIPRAMSTIERFVFWHTYLAHIGARPVLSPPTDQRLAADGVELSPAQPCYPIQVAHGHVARLFEEGVRYVLVPNILDNETHEASSCTAHYCPWTQTLPHVLRSTPRFEPLADRILAPALHFQMGPDQVKRALRPMAARLGAGRGASDRAVDRAYAAQRRLQTEQLSAGKRALDLLDATREPGLVLVGRPYNIYDRAVNCDIPRKLRRHYGVNVLPIDFLVSGRELADAPGDNMYWTSGRRALAAAQLVAGRPHLHVVYITNFKCGPDSYIKHFVRRSAGSPLLVLQFDGHGNDAGYLTRCEAFLDSKGILR